MTPDRQPGRHCATQGPPANAMVETMKDKPRTSRIDAAAEGPPFGMVPSFPKACYIGPMPIPRHPEIIFDHPPTSPDSFPAPLDYLIDVPSLHGIQRPLSGLHSRDLVAHDGGAARGPKSSRHPGLPLRRRSPGGRRCRPKTVSGSGPGVGLSEPDPGPFFGGDSRGHTDYPAWA